MTLLQNHILKLTGLSEKAYLSIVEQYGIAFIAFYCGPNAPWAVEYLSKSKSFWTWWKQQWQIRDEIFELEYAEYSGCDGDAMLCELYLDANAPKAIAGYPGNWIIQEAWNEMINDVEKEKGVILC